MHVKSQRYGRKSFPVKNSSSEFLERSYLERGVSGRKVRASGGELYVSRGAEERNFYEIQWRGHSRGIGVRTGSNAPKTPSPPNPQRKCIRRGRHKSGKLGYCGNFNSHHQPPRRRNSITFVLCNLWNFAIRKIPGNISW